MDSGDFKRIADAVTIHDNHEASLGSGPHRGIMEIAYFVKPDVWSVYYESQDIIDALEAERRDNATYPEVRVLDGHRFYSDRLIGGSFSTTAIASRIGGVASNGGV